MIKNFKNKNLERLYLHGDTRGIQPHFKEKLVRILDIMDSAGSLEDMKFPGSNLHKLEPKNESRWSVYLSGNWRIVFMFSQGDFFEVELKDTH